MPGEQTMKARTMRKFVYSTIFVLIICVASNIVLVSAPTDSYHTHEELINVFKSMCDRHGELASYRSVGKSYEGRDIWMFEIGNSEGGRILWDGSLHGDEEQGYEIIYLIAAWLLESGEPAAERILERNHVLFVPIVNIDSYARQNRNFENCRYGVDLNRNFENGWQAMACDPNNYPGPYPASEPETQVMGNVFATYKPTFYVNLHQGSSSAMLAYYRGSDPTLINQMSARYDEISGERGVRQYSVRSMGSNGFAIGDAHDFGSCAWLFETQDSSWYYESTHSYNDVVNIYFPKCLPVFVAMCEVCESGAPPPPLLGDLNGDGVVDAYDIEIVSMAYLSSPGDLNWNELADLDADGDVDFDDIVTVAMNCIT